jgi:pyruvate dehydrogenase E1 component
MIESQEDIFYYLTVLNENYQHPAMPAGAEKGILKGMYLLKAADTKLKGHKVQLLGSGAILREVIAGAELLQKDFGIGCDVWSVTSFTELARDAAAVDRWNLLNPTEKPRVAYVTEQLSTRGDAPVVASTDYMRMFAEQIRPFVPSKYRVLGTDGFGRSDYRRKLRSHFEVDRHFVALAALKSLADENKVPSTKVAEAIKKYGIDPNKPNPVRV